MTDDYYRILGVSAEATGEEIEHAYREQVRRHHPDLCPDDPRARRIFQRIQAAFDALHDPLRREDYDLTRRGPRVSPSGGPSRLGPAGSLATEAQQDALRFVRAPGTSLIPYRRRHRWETQADWLVGSDFLLPLVLVLPFLAVHVTWLTMTLLRAVWQ